MVADRVQNIALIGAGMVAQTHLLAIADLQPKVRLAGIVTRNPDRTSAAAETAGDVCGYPVRSYQDIDQVCSDASIDWAIVITPPNARKDIVQRLANAGKGILCEKPIERTYKAAEEIVRYCEKQSVPLGVVFQHRARQAAVSLQNLIEQGILGELAIAEAVIPWWREQAYYDEPGRGTFERDGGGVLISQAIHTLDLMLSLTGPVSEVQAMTHTTRLHSLEAEDYVTAGLKFSSGAIGSVIASTANFPGEAESITLHFTKCVAHLQSGRLKLNWRNGKIEEMGEVAATGGGADPMAFTHEWHRDVIEDYANSIAENRPPMATGRDGLKVHALIDAIVHSSKSGQVTTVKGLESGA